MELWHGSQQIVRRPLRERCRPHNDYGAGFYCTEEPDLAREWACAGTSDGFANRYELDESGLSMLDLNDARFSVLHWLSVLVTHRTFNVTTPIAREALRFLASEFAVDVETYDVVRGYRADDSYFSFARAFLNDGLSVAQLERAMRLGKLGEQVVLKSAASFEAISFVSFERVRLAEYRQKRELRDRTVRREYALEAERYDREGIYMHHLITGEVSTDDRRLFGGAA